MDGQMEGLTDGWMDMGKTMYLGLQWGIKIVATRIISINVLIN